jgi:hypothetical protein
VNGERRSCGKYRAFVEVARKKIESMTASVVYIVNATWVVVFDTKFKESNEGMMNKKRLRGDVAR